jgi:GNAT superfamily N-acetyltransferase
MSELRVATPDDVAAVCEFGEAHIRPHYAPLIGASAADEQVRRWWREPAINAAVTGGLVVVAEAGGDLAGVGQRGRRGADHVVYKLYVHPRHRGHGLGVRLLGALVDSCPPTLIGCASSTSRPTSARGRSTSVKASPWTGSRRARPATPRSGSCGVPAG